MAIRIRKGTRLDPNKKGYYTVEGDTRQDVEKIRGSELVKQVQAQGQKSLQKQAEDVRHGEVVRYPSGIKLRLPTPMAEGAIKYMRQNVPGGPPATRVSVQMKAYVKNGRIVREGDPDY